MYHDSVLERLSDRQCFGCIAVICAVLYVPSLGNDLVNWDDTMLITANPVVQNFDVVRGFTTFDPELYIPLTLLTYQIEQLIAGNAAWIYHLSNLLLHSANACLLLLIIGGLTKNRLTGLIAALLFAVHPVNSEAVLWASARKDLLSAFFFLLAIHLYMKGNRLSIGAFFLGLLSKVSIVVLPFILLLIDHWEGRVIDARRIRAHWPYFLLSIVFGSIALFGKTATAWAIPISKSPLLAAKSTVFLLQKILLPVGLSPIYSQHTPVVIESPEFFLPLIIVFLAAVLLWIFRKRAPLLVWCALWFVIIVSPAYFTFSKNGYVLFASNRYVYLASVGVCIWVTATGMALASRNALMRAAIVVLGVLIVGASVVLTYRQVWVWNTSETLMQHALIAGYEHPLVWNNLGAALRSAGRSEEALEAFLKAAEKGQPQAHANAGNLYREVGNEAKALELFAAGMDAARAHGAFGTQDLAPHFSVAQFLLSQGRNAEALKVFEEAAQLGPHIPSAHVNLGMLLLKNGSVSGAKEHLERATELDRYSATAWYHLALAHALQGSRAQAIDALEQTLRVDPGYEDAEEQLQKLRGG